MGQTLVTNFLYARIIVLRLARIKAPMKKTFHSGCCLRKSVQLLNRPDSKRSILHHLQNNYIFAPGLNPSRRHIMWIIYLCSISYGRRSPITNRTLSISPTFEILLAPTGDDLHVPAEKCKYKRSKKSQPLASFFNYLKQSPYLLSPPYNMNLVPCQRISSCRIKALHKEDV